MPQPDQHHDGTCGEKHACRGRFGHRLDGLGGFDGIAVPWRSGIEPRRATGYLGPPRREGKWFGDGWRGRGGGNRCHQAAAADRDRNQLTDHLDPPARLRHDCGRMAQQSRGAMNPRANRVPQDMQYGGSAVHHWRDRVVNDSPADDRHGPACAGFGPRAGPAAPPCLQPAGPANLDLNQHLFNN